MPSWYRMTFFRNANNANVQRIETLRTRPVSCLKISCDYHSTRLAAIARYIYIDQKSEEAAAEKSEPVKPWMFAGLLADRQVPPPNWLPNARLL
jgi:hypothetical protein